MWGGGLGGELQGLSISTFSKIRSSCTGSALDWHLLPLHFTLFFKSYPVILIFPCFQLFVVGGDGGGGLAPLRSLDQPLLM